MSAHTPGPWVFKQNVEPGDVSHIATVAWREDYCIGRDFSVPDMASYDDHGTAEADARLIAAAPDLLEALKMARQRCTLAQRAICDAAIAAATGETE